MKMRNGKRWIEVTPIVTVLAALLGLASGFLLFRVVTLQLAMINLDRHAWRYMLRAEQSSKASEDFSIQWPRPASPPAPTRRLPSCTACCFSRSF